MFAKCRNISRPIDWQRLFWDGKTTAFKGDMARETDSINSGVYEEKPYVVTVTPRVRAYVSGKAKEAGLQTIQKEKEAMRRAEIQRLKRNGSC